MLNTNPENICQLIQLSRQFHGQEAVVIPDVGPAPESDWSVQILAGHADDPTLQEFYAVVDDLEPDQQQEVVALLWLGRDDYTLEEWDDALAYAQECWNEQTADYLLSHPLLADYLSEGLDLHGYACEV